MPPRVEKWMGSTYNSVGDIGCLQSQSKDGERRHSSCAMARAASTPTGPGIGKGPLPAPIIKFSFRTSTQRRGGGAAIANDRCCYCSVASPTSWFRVMQGHPIQPSVDLFLRLLMLSRPPFLLIPLCPGKTNFGGWKSRPLLRSLLFQTHVFESSSFSPSLCPPVRPFASRLLMMTCCVGIERRNDEREREAEDRGGGAAATS